MNFYTGYLWGQRETTRQSDRSWNERDSVLLQQVICHKTSIVLACVSDGYQEGCYLTGQLKIWFQNHMQILLHDRREGREITNLLGKELKRIYHDLCDVYCPDINFSGILIINSQFWLMQGGFSENYYFNRRFQNTQCRRLGENYCTEWMVREGILERGVGILLGTKSFMKYLSLSDIKQCLAAQDIVTDGQIERRLHELAAECVRRGQQEDGSAVYIKSID